VDEIVKSPNETQSDSFYFVEGKLIMHNKARYTYFYPPGREAKLEGKLSGGGACLDCCCRRRCCCCCCCCCYYYETLVSVGYRADSADCGIRAASARYATAPAVSARCYGWPVD
jgi:hypothetical protein